MLVVKPKWKKKSCFPFTLFAMIWIFIQGPLSFQADYINMAYDSIYHVIDRFVAVINVFFYVLKIATCFWHARPSVVACEFVGLAFTITCFMKSQKAQIMQNTDDFCLWHSIWHFMPLLSNVVDLVEILFFEKRDSSKSNSNVNTTKSLKESLTSKESQFWLEALMNDDRGADDNRGWYSNIKSD